MRTPRSSILLAFAVLLFAALSSSQLFLAWKDAPLERRSWILFLLWCLPIGYVPYRNQELALNYHFLWVSLGVTLLGILTDINAVRYLGFAAALASFVCWNGWLVPWIISSVVWMPAFGWAGIRIFPDYLFEVRLFLILLCLTITLLGYRYDKKV